MTSIIIYIIGFLATYAIASRIARTFAEDNNRFYNYIDVAACVGLSIAWPLSLLLLLFASIVKDFPEPPKFL